MEFSLPDYDLFAGRQEIRIAGIDTEHFVERIHVPKWFHAAPHAAVMSPHHSGGGEDLWNHEQPGFHSSIWSLGRVFPP